MNGVDWNAMRDSSRRASPPRDNGDEFRRLMQLMIGELNASHIGAGSAATAAHRRPAAIGVLFSPPNTTPANTTRAEP